MSISTIHYIPPIRRPLAVPELDYQLIDTAKEQYAAGAFLDATHTIFHHLFPNQTVDLAAPFSFVQGSSRVTAKIDDGIFFLSVPVVKLPAGGAAIAALRYLLTRVNGSGQMFQARLHGDDVYLEFADKLSSLHPQKLLETLRRMPFSADAHDDWMIAQFAATGLERVDMEGVSDDESVRAGDFWQQHWNDIDELMKESQRKRSMFFLNEVTAFAVNRVRVTLPLGGSLFPRLMEASSTFNNDHVDAMKRESTLVKTIKEMKAIGAPELRQSLAHQTYAISPIARGTPEQLTNFFGPGHYTDAINKYQTSGQSIDAAMALLSSGYYLLANFSWPGGVGDALRAGLIESSGKPWHDAAAALLLASKNLLEEFVADDEGGGDDEDDEDDEDEDEDEDEAGGDE